MLILPEVMFNASGLTLDGYHREQLLQSLEKRGGAVRVAPTTPAELLDFLEEDPLLQH